MEFLKAGEPVESNIFNQLDEKKRALIEKGVDVINLSIGTPDFQPDKHVMEAVSRAALDPDMYKYSLTETPELLEAVEKWYKRRYDVDLADDEIIQVSARRRALRTSALRLQGRTTSFLRQTRATRSSPLVRS